MKTFGRNLHPYRPLALIATTIMIIVLALDAMSHAPAGAQGIERGYSQQQKLTASDGDLNHQFGISVAIDGDTAVVGSPALGAHQGKAYVFTRSNGVWTEQQKLTASDKSTDAKFGSQVALNNGHLFISAPDTNSVYVFEYVNNSWTEQQILSVNGEENLQDFGQAIALDGDTALIGSQRGISLEGVTYIFRQENDLWSLHQTLQASDHDEKSEYDGFGETVALDGDRAIIGANGWMDYPGAAYVFKATNGVWTEQQKLIPPGMQENVFGWAVGIENNTAFVGDIFDAESGSVSVFKEASGVWTSPQTLLPSDGEAADVFGYSIAMKNDQAVIGAIFKDNHSGSVYVFGLENGLWTEQAKLNALNRVENEYFGQSVALTTDSVIVGAVENNGMIQLEGSAYIFVADQPDPTATPVTPTSTPITSTSTAPTPTPPSDNQTELLINGGFELNVDGNQSPDGWKLKQESGDKLKCNDGGEAIAYEGLCAFQFKGSDGENSKLQQDVDLTAHSVSAGDTLTLSGQVWAKGDVDSKVTLKVKYAPLPTTKLVIDVVNPTGKQWTAFNALQPTLSLVITDTPTEVTLQIKHASQSGKVRYDALSLIQQSNSLVPLGVPQ